MLMLPGIEGDDIPGAMEFLWPNACVVKRQGTVPGRRFTGCAVRIEDTHQVICKRRFAATPGGVDMNDEAGLKDGLFFFSGGVTPPWFQS